MRLAAGQVRIHQYLAVGRDDALEVPKFMIDFNLDDPLGRGRTWLRPGDVAFLTAAALAWLHTVDPALHAAVVGDADYDREILSGRAGARYANAITRFREFAEHAERTLAAPASAAPSPSLQS